MKKVLLSRVCLLLSVLFLSQFSIAQTAIAPNTWSGSGLSTGTASDPSSFTAFPASATPGSTRINVSQWNRGAGLTATATTTALCYNSSNWSLGSTLASAQAGDNFIYFTVTNDGTVEDSISAITLLSQVSATGPSTVQMMYNLGASDIAFGSAVTGYATATAITLNFNMAAGTSVHLCPSQSVTFKLYGWGATNVAGTLRILDNSSITIGFFPSYSVVATASPNVACSGTGVSLGGVRTGGSYGPHTYAWTGPITVTPANVLSTGWFSVPAGASGVYTLTSTDWWGCVAIDTANLVVNASPSTPTITPSGTVNICSYDSVVFTAPAGYTYEWDTLRAGGGPPIYDAIPGATSSTYTAKRANRYRVVITATGGCSASSATTRVIVNPSAPSTVTTSGSLAFCTGGSVTLTAAAGTGYTYQWYNGTTAIAGETNAAFVATASGSYNVRVTVPTGCVTQSATYTVVEVTLPTISTSDTVAFCQGGSATLRVSISSAATGVVFQWKRNSVNIPGATGTAYVATVSGDYTCFVNIPGSCSVTTNDIVITVHPTPNPLITVNAANNKLSTYSYYTRYQWYLNTVTIPGATTKTVSTYTNGSYRVMVTDTFGCVRLSDPYGMYNLAVNNINSPAEVRIYPNPATDVLHIETAAEVRVLVSSVEGKVILNNSSSKDVNMSTLPSGLYIVTVSDTNGNRLLVEKVVKQ